MPELLPLIRGRLRDHPDAPAFVAEVLRIHRRYAGEVVAANRLCPHLRDVDTGFGTFCVMLDPGPELDVEEAIEAIRAAKSQVIHVVYPCARPAPSAFERFSAAIARALKQAFSSPPVMATFHPDLSGDPTGPYRLVGMLRRAPDPFVQLIPEGLHQGGTVFAADPGSAEHVEDGDPAIRNFEKLKDGGVDRLMAVLAEIHADRARSYAPYLEAFKQPA